VERAVSVVYGGGSIGLMGVVADAVVAAGGQVIGVIPEGLVDREPPHEGLSELRVVGSMHERKALMSSLADAAIALPGGMGTLEETLEFATWSQLGIHTKPCGLFNVSGYYDPLAGVLDHALANGFISLEDRSIVLVESDPEALLERLDAWLTRSADWASSDARSRA
jgi:uncharacterized protein (TIGR00730 family)